MGPARIRTKSYQGDFKIFAASNKFLSKSLSKKLIFIRTFIMNFIFTACTERLLKYKISCIVDTFQCR
jgi:hypothetical protein